MYFQYKTTFTGPETTGDIYFGFKDGYWYLAEIQVYNYFELGGENGSPHGAAWLMFLQIHPARVTLKKWTNEYT